MSERFTLPLVGAPSTVAFPPVTRTALANGLRLWSVEQSAAPVVSCALVLEGGTAADPADRPGLSSLVASLATEGAGSRDAIAMADALARLGAHLDVQAGADATTFTLTTLTRHVDAALELLADVVRRPRLADDAFARVRDLRLSRLRQASRVAGTIADRALAAAVLGDHPYGHGSLGTSRAVQSMTPEEARAYWHNTCTPARATLLVAGDIDAATLQSAVTRVFGDWAVASTTSDAAMRAIAPVGAVAAVTREVIAVHRSGAAQAELRVGQVGPSRHTPDYHALITLNALLGGQFTSRINRNLRERRAITYGARSAFDMRRAGGLFSCDTSVQADSAGVAAAEILKEFSAVTVSGAIAADELEQACASLTRGYVRHFETSHHLLRALVELAIYDLEASTFDQFVPLVSAVVPDDLTRVAQAAIRPDECAIVVVTDLDQHRDALATLGRTVTVTEVEF